MGIPVPRSTYIYNKIFDKKILIGNKMTKLELVKYVVTLLVDADRWVDTIPSEIRDSYFDNPYSNNVGLVMDTTLKMCLGENLYEDVMWWVYDARSQLRQNGVSTIKIDRGISSIQYILKCDQDYFDYLELEYSSDLLNT